MVKILLVDDDDVYREQLADQLSRYQEFAVEQAATAAEALSAIDQDPSIGAVLIDVGLPDMDGREACRLIRRSGFSAPIIMVTGADSEADVILGLDSGATDYLTKPFSIGILMARLRAHLRQQQDSVDAVFTIGPYLFQPGAKLLVHRESERRLRLTGKEALILKRLYRSRNKVVSRRSLLQEVWGYHPDVETHTLETHVYRMRQKIEPDPAHAQMLVTESDGYRLVW